MASSLAAGKAGGTKTAFSISLLPASAFLEVSTTQGLSPEVQSDNETFLRVTQLCGWSWADPGTSHRETPMVPLKPCQSMGQCDFPRDLLYLGACTAPFSQLNLSGTISFYLSITYLPGFPLFGEKKTQNKRPLKVTFPVRGHQSLLVTDWGSAWLWCSDGMFLSSKGWKLLCPPKSQSWLKFQFSAVLF